MASSDGRRRLCAGWLIGLFVTGLQPSTALAADGAYDPDFAQGGRRLLSINDRDHELVGMVQRSNRKIVMAGRCRADNGTGAIVFTFCAAELSASGAPTDFGTQPDTNGPGRFLLTDLRSQLPNEQLSATAATLDAQGRLIIVGQSLITTSHAVLARVAADGRSVEDLHVRPNAPDESEALYFDVSMDASQRILLVGRVVRSGVGVVGVVSRLLPNLQPDSSFGEMGTIYLQVPDHSTQSYRVRSDNQGRVVVLSNLTAIGSAGFSRVDRFSSSGAVEPGFGFGGHSNLGVGPGVASHFAFGLAVDNSDRILVLGQILDSVEGDLDLSLIRLRATGTGDVSRKLEVEDLVSVGANEGLTGALQIQPDGRILIVGACERLGNSDRFFLTVRMLENFDLDPSYGAGGVSVGSFEGAPLTGLDDFAESLALDPVGGLLVAGTGLGHGAGAVYQFGIARIMNAAVAGDPLFADGYED